MSNKVVGDGAVPVLPKSLDIMADVAILVSLSLTARTVIQTYLMVISPTPLKRPMRTQSCQNSGLFNRAIPVISIQE
jgi:hypothetical protein